MRFYVNAICVSSEVIRVSASTDDNGLCIEINSHEKNAVQEAEDILKENEIQFFKYGENGFCLMLSADDNIEVLP